MVNETILFKNILESEKVTNKINENFIDKERNIYIILSYLNFVRKEKNLDVFLSSYFSGDATLPMKYMQEKKHLPMIAVNILLYSIFFQRGYFYHVTNTRNVDSILEQGIITLNKKFDQNLFIQVEEVNQCWETIAKRNKIYKDYNTLMIYQTR